MGSSLILTGGVATAKTLREVITQPAHGFAVGDVLRWDAGSAKYRLAMADSAENAEVVGVVDTVDDASNFKLVYSGYLDVSTLAGITVPVLFLSGASAGKLVTTPPSSIGSVIKPVLTKANNTNGYVLTNYLGTQIGGSSTIAIDEIQPVGTIAPFAGTVIPYTWLECNGSSYGISSYPELYDKIRYTSGDRMPIYGSVYELTVNSATDSAAAFNGAAVGDIVYINNRTSTATATTPTHTTHDFVGVILYKGILPSNSVWAGFIVQLLPKYDSTTKTFSYPNTAISVAANYVSGYFSKISVYANQSSTTAKFSNIALINDGLLTHFNTPDLRGRFAIGQNTTTLSEAETDSAYLSAITGNYPLGSEGGEEKHTLTTAEMPAHDHPQNVSETSGQYYWVSNESSPARENVNTVTAASSDWEFSREDRVASQGGDAPHNNMPPYLAVRYIIKAKPYTRAAIIDGVDLPYSNLLVRSTDSNSLRSELLSGVSGGDLVFYTNSGEASKTGTERMRISNSGIISVGNFVTNYTNTSYRMQVSGSASGDSGISINLAQNESPYGFGFGNVTANSGSGAGDAPHATIYSAANKNYASSAFALGFQNSASVNSGSGFTPLLIGFNASSRIGIGITAPGASLDVNGTLKVGDFGGATNVMVKPTNAAGGVGQIIPLFTWGAGIGSATVPRNHAAPIPSGTWLIVLNGQSDANTGDGENATLVMAQTWVVPSGKYLVFAHSDVYTSAASSSTSGLAWKLINASDVGLYRTASNPFTPSEIISGNGWNNICKSNGTAQLINEQNADTATGGDKSASGCVYQGGGGWYVTTQIQGYALRIA